MGAHVVPVQLTLPCRLTLCKVGKLNQAKFGVTLTGLLTIFQMRFFEGSLDMSIAVACAIEVENYLKTRRFKHLYSCLIFIGL